MTQRVLFEFVWLPTFERTSKKLLAEADGRDMARRLLELVERQPDVFEEVLVSPTTKRASPRRSPSRTP